MPSTDPASLPGLPETRNELVVADGVALLRRPPEPRLAEALAAVPGVPLDGFAWALRIGPDRAASIARIAESLKVTVDETSRAALTELSGGRGDNPVIEMVGAPAKPRLSLLDDWGYLWAEELRSVPGTRDLPDAGRVEVPLSEWTAPTISSVVAVNGLRLSPACDLALREALERPGAQSSAPPAELEQATHNVSIPAAGADVLLSAEPEGPTALGIAGLPGVRSLGRGRGRWVMPPSPQGARALRELSRVNADITLDDAARTWLREAPRWIAHVEVDASGTTPRLVIGTSWGEPPPSLSESLDGIVHHARRILAPLHPPNLRALARAIEREAEVTFSSAAQNAMTWLGENTDATELPPAELDVIQEVDGPRYVIEAVWDEQVETEFLTQEAALGRKAGHRETEVPASAWPPDMLARFIRARRVALTRAARALIEGVVEGDDDAQRLLAMSKAHDAELEIEGLGGELMPFQRAGVVYALERRRVFLADEQGLGKPFRHSRRSKPTWPIPPSSFARLRSS